MNSFSEFLLPEPLLRGLASAGFETPTPVQEAVIPPAIEGTDLMVSASTGSGKTAAFLLPMLERFLGNPQPSGGTRGLILVPTRELARQIHAHFMRLASYTRLTLGVITGGESRAHQVALLRKNPEILVATPGRLLELLELGHADMGDLEILVLDEADRMLDMGFAEDVLAIIGYCSTGRQSLLFSATLKHQGLQRITAPLLKDPRVLRINPIRQPHPNIQHQMLLSDHAPHKQQLLLWLLQHESYEKALVFVNTRDTATGLGGHLMGQGARVAVLHGELEQRERNRVLGLLHAGQVRVLIATDVAARGLDIPGVQRVINFDVPRNGEDYLHRTGRTGRAGESGIAISLVEPSAWNRFQSIVRYLRLVIESRSIKDLPATFTGTPKKKGPRKTANKAGPKKEAATSASPTPKIKNRLRDRKNIGKRRQPSTENAVPSGHAPPTKRKQADKPREKMALDSQSNDRGASMDGAD